MPREDTVTAPPSKKPPLSNRPGAPGAVAVKKSPTSWIAAGVVVVLLIVLGVVFLPKVFGSDDQAASEGYLLTTPGTLTVATEGTYRPFTYHDEAAASCRLRRRDRRGGRRQARPRGDVPGDAVGRDLRGTGGGPVRRHRQPGLDQRRARGEVPASASRTRSRPACIVVPEDDDRHHDLRRPGRARPRPSR